MVSIFNEVYTSAPDQSHESRRFYRAIASLSNSYVTVNNSSAEQKGSGNSQSVVEFSTMTTAMITTAAVLLVCFSALANLMVILAFFKEKKLQKLGNYLLVNLAVADFIMTFVSVPVFTHYTLTGTWLAGETLCNIWLTVDYINCNATCFSILAIGIDRYWSVAHPFHYRTNMSKQWVAVYISFIWIIPTLLYVPLIFIIQQFNIFDLSKNGRIEKCQVHFRSNFFWVFAVTSVNFWVVLVVLSVLYIKIYKVTKFFWSRRSNRSQQATPNIRLDHSGSHPASRQNQSSSQLEFGGDASNNNNNVDVDAPAEERNQLPLADVRSSQSEEYLSKKYTKRSSKDMYFKMTESNLIVSVSSNQMAPCQKRRDSNQLKNNRHWPDDPKAVKLAPKFKTGSISLGVPSTDVHPFRRHSSACPGDVPKTAETPSSPSFQDARLRIKRVSEAILRLPLQLMENMTEQKTSMRILTSIMTSFVICWSPYSVVALIHSFGSELISAQLVEMVYGFCYISCLVNPIVYTCANKAFRDAFKRILRFNDFPFCCLKTKYKIPSPFYATTKV